MQCSSEAKPNLEYPEVEFSIVKLTNCTHFKKLDKTN